MATDKQPRLIRRACGTMGVHMLLLERDPAFRTRQQRLENETTRRRALGFIAAELKLAKIKVVVNVVYKEPSQNISDAQINSQIKALNLDFRAKNSDKKKTPAVWNGLVADSQVEFALYKVTRTRTTQSSFGADDSVKRASTGGVAPLNPSRYLNLWVCALGDGLLGYAQFPGGPKSTDGVVINYRAFGTTGTAQSPFNKGRTATHEVGHYSTCVTFGATLKIAAGAILSHSQLRRAKFWQTSLPEGFLPRRSQWGHVCELHGLRGRCRNVHVYPATGGTHAYRSRRPQTDTMVEGT